MKIYMGVASLIMISVTIGVQLGGVVGFKNFNVGGNVTWRVPEGNDTSFFDQWAASKRFHVGDSLLFQYQNDSVLVVDKYGYYHCDTTKATATYTDGNTVVKLERPGFIYFITGTGDNCRNGQRLIVDVMSPHSSTVAAPPESYYQQAAESPTPVAAEAYTSGSPQSQLQVSAAFLGLVVITSMLFV